MNKSDAVQQWHLRPAVAQPSPHTSAAGSDSAPSTPIELWTGGEKETAESRIRDRIIALSHKYRNCKISEPFLFDTLTRSPAPFNMSVYDPERLSTAISFYDPETEACDTVDIQTGNLLWHESGSKELAFVAPKPNWLEAYQAKAARMQRLQDAMVLAAPNRTTVTVPVRSPIEIVRPTGSALRGQPVSVQMPSTAGAPLSGGGRTVPPVRRHNSVAFQVTLDQPIWGRSHSVHQNRANAELDRAIRSDPEFAKQMEMLIPGVSEDVARKGGRETPPNYIWHHATIGQGDGRAGTMQLVPVEQHTPGSQYWNVLHPNPGGGGGYSEWARPAGAPSRH